MDSTLVRNSANQTTAGSGVRIWSYWLSGRRGRRLREAFLAYVFLFPAFLIISVFGLFPLLFAAYQSTLRGLNRIVGPYDGLGNYVRAIGNLTYVLAFWVAVICLFLAIRSLVTASRTAREKGETFWPWSLSGIPIGLGIGVAVVYIYRLLPLMLDIPSQLRGAQNTGARFRQLMFQAWLDGSVQQAFWGALVLLVVGIALYLMLEHAASHTHHTNYMGPFISAVVLLLLALALGWLTWTEIQKAYAEALAAGEGLAIWSQFVTISAGFVLLLIAWWLWDGADEQLSDYALVARLGAAAVLLVGGWVLIGELPRIIAQGDKEWWIGLQATVWYSVGTVPTQLAISLLLAALLFQDLRGKGFFRIVYFIPYVAPFVGTAAIFRILFSNRPNAPINSLIGVFGGGSLEWLNEPTGIFQLILGNSVTLPTWAAGPSLALVVIMIYGVWSYIGFNTVVFMAGLGSIPRTVYEAAAIDGAGRWQQFRHVTLPLLSPTIYFLTLLSVIGTFKAFNHIYVLRTAAALGSTDTASVVIFQAFKRDTRFGYASALAILLLLIILVLTYANNRIASKRVFYG
ncbi:MAG: sugar ABC transporter permease [Caldilineaceae bacterium]